MLLLNSKECLKVGLCILVKHLILFVLGNVEGTSCCLHNKVDEISDRRPECELVIFPMRLLDPCRSYSPKDFTDVPQRKPIVPHF